MHQATTENVSGISRRLSIVSGTLRLVEVRIVDVTSVDLTRFPGEGSATVWAPHLVAAADLVDPLTAGRAGMCVLANHSSAGHRVWVAHVWLVFVVADDFETVLACMKFADLALVCRAEIATTVSIRTGHDELAALWISSIFSLPNVPTPTVMNILLSLQDTLLLFEGKNLVAEFCDGSFFIAATTHTLGSFHCLGNLAHLAIKQKLLAMLTVVFRHPGVIQVGDQELLAPGLTAVHAVWVLSGSKEVLAGACFTSGPLTVPLLAVNRGFVGAVKGFATDRAGIVHNVTFLETGSSSTLNQFSGVLEYLLKKMYNEKRTTKRALQKEH